MNKEEIETALSKIVHGVCIITTKFEGRVNGMTAAWVMRASFVPPIVVVSIGKSRYTHELIQKAKVFAVNILDSSCIELAKRFGFYSGKEFNKFEQVEWIEGKTGSPILTQSCAFLDCELVSTHPAGDHTLFVGKVIDGRVNKDTNPLIYHRDDFY